MLQNLQLYNVRSTSCKLQSQFAILNYNYNLQLQCKFDFIYKKNYNYNFKFDFFYKKNLQVCKIVNQTKLTI